MKEDPLIHKQTPQPQQTCRISDAHWLPLRGASTGQTPRQGLLPAQRPAAAAVLLKRRLRAENKNSSQGNA